MSATMLSTVGEEFFEVGRGVVAGLYENTGEVSMGLDFFATSELRRFTGVFATLATAVVLGIRVSTLGC